MENKFSWQDGDIEIAEPGKSADLESSEEPPDRVKAAKVLLTGLAEAMGLEPPDDETIAKLLEKQTQNPVRESAETAPVATAYERGIETIQSVTETAVRRMLSRGDAALGQATLFSAEELQIVAAAIGAGTSIARVVGEEEARRQIAERTVDAELSVLGLSDDELRQHPEYA